MTVARREAFRTRKVNELDVARAWTLKERFRQVWEYAWGRPEVLRPLVLGRDP